MGFTIDASVLQRCVRYARGATARKSTIPALGTVKVTERVGTVDFSGTDLDIYATAWAPASGMDAPGTWHINADALLNVASALSGPVRIEHAASVATLVAGRSKFKLSTPLDELPDAPAMGTVSTLSTEESAAMLAAIQAVRYASSVDETRYVLNGVFFGNGDAVATDGHRMAFAPGVAALAKTIVIPNRACDVLRGMGDGVVVSVKMTGDAATGIYAATVHDGVEFVTHAKLIEGRFPDYKQVIPKEAGTVVSVDRKGLTACIKRVGVLGGKDHSVVFEAGADGVTVTSRSADSGDATDSVGAKVTGVDVRCGFNGSYMLEALGAASGDVVELCVADAQAPVVVRAGGVLTGIVMPMRI